MKHFSFILNYILLPLQIFQLVSSVWEYYRGGFFFFLGRINDLYDLWIKYHIFLLFFSFLFLFFIEDNMSKAFIFLFFYFFSILNIKWRRSNVIWFHRISMSSQNLWLYYYMSKSQIKSKWHTFSCFDGWWEKY